MSKVSIKNFKSIKHLEFNSKKFNIFIRFDSAINLFYDNQTSLEIEVKIGNFNLKVKAVENDNISIDLNSSSYCVLDAYGNLKDLKQEDINEKMSIKFYRFRKLNKFPKKVFSSLLPLSLLEKANKDDLAVFIVYYKNYETKIRELSYEEKMRILEEGKDVFFNIEQFIEE